MKYKKIEISPEFPLELHYVKDSQFIVFHKVNKCYVDLQGGLTKYLDRAMLFDDYKFPDKINKSIIVVNNNGEFLIDSTGRCSVPFAFIGEASPDGYRPAKMGFDEVVKWGYIPSDIKSFKPDKLFTPNDKTFFVATKVGGYMINGCEIGEYKYQWLVGHPRIRHGEFKPFDTSEKFFSGISKNYKSQEIITLYKANTNSRPFISPHDYLAVSYKSKQVFFVTQLSGLKSVLYFDNNNQSFEYWPETDIREFTKYEIKEGDILVADKPDGSLNIIHKNQGCLSYFWDNVRIEKDVLSFFIDNNPFNLKLDKTEAILKAYEQSLSNLFNGTVNTVAVEIPKQAKLEQNSIAAENETLISIDWIIVLSEYYTNRIEGCGTNEYKIPTVKVQRKLRNQLRVDDRVVIIDYFGGIYIVGTKKGTIINKGYYFISVEKEGHLNGLYKLKDGYKINTHYYFENLQVDEKNIPEYLPLLVKSDTNNSEILKINDDNMVNNLTENEPNEILYIRKIYSDLAKFSIPQQKIIEGLSVLFGDYFNKNQYGIQLKEKFAKSLAVEPNINDVLAEIKTQLNEEQWDEFSHRYEMEKKYRQLDKKDAITVAAKELHDKFGIEYEWIFDKLKPYIPEIKVDDMLRHICNEDVCAQIKINDSIGNFYELKNQKFKLGDVLPVNFRDRISYDKDEKQMFIRINEDNIIATAPTIYCIEGVGGEYQEFGQNNNTKIKDSKGPCVIVKLNEEGKIVLHDLAKYDHYSYKDTDKGKKKILFYLKSIIKPN